MIGSLDCSWFIILHKVGCNLHIYMVISQLGWNVPILYFSNIFLIKKVTCLTLSLSSLLQCHRQLWHQFDFSRCINRTQWHSFRQHQDCCVSNTGIPFEELEFLQKYFSCNVLCCVRKGNTCWVANMWILLFYPINHSSKRCWKNL